MVRCSDNVGTHRGKFCVFAVRIDWQGYHEPSSAESCVLDVRRQLLYIFSSLPANLPDGVAHMNSCTKFYDISRSSSSV